MISFTGSDTTALVHAGIGAVDAVVYTRDCCCCCCFMRGVVGGDRCTAFRTVAVAVRIVADGVVDTLLHIL